MKSCSKTSYGYELSPQYFAMCRNLAHTAVGIKHRKGERYGGTLKGAERYTSSGLILVLVE